MDAWRKIMTLKTFGIFLIILLHQEIWAANDTIMAKADTLLQYPRVVQAKDASEEVWKIIFSENQLSFPPKQLYLRAFKLEKTLEVWASDDTVFRLLKTYPICMIPGYLGPKIKQGDKQVPEGLYIIDKYNPLSDFHLSMRINYPNAADSVRSKAEKDPGGDIYIHGDCYSVGCLPMGDEAISEIFWLCTAWQIQNPQQSIPFHIFPFELNDDKINLLSQELALKPLQTNLWKQLKPVYTVFNNTYTLPQFFIDEQGNYQLKH